MNCKWQLWLSGVIVLDSHGHITPPLLRADPSPGYILSCDFYRKCYYSHLSREQISQVLTVSAQDKNRWHPNPSSWAELRVPERRDKSSRCGLIGSLVESMWVILIKKKKVGMTNFYKTWYDIHFFISFIFTYMGNKALYFSSLLQKHSVVSWNPLFSVNFNLQRTFYFPQSINGEEPFTIDLSVSI